MNEVRILLLGPVELWVGERRAALGGPKQRALLALLALDLGRVVSRDRAAEALWGESLPEGHAQRLHTVVSRLRAALRDAGGPEVVETREVGYLLRVDPGHVDAARAAAALHQARELRAAGSPADAAAVAHDGLELWRGPPLADLLDNGWASDDLRRLEDLKLSLLEEEFDCRLVLGASSGLVEELQAACAQAPLRERLHAQLMLALHASGRRADALHAYDRIRRSLSEELGIEPGAALREAHRIVLARELDGRWPPPAGQRRRAARRRRRIVVTAAVVTSAVAATAGVLLASDGGGEQRAALRLHAGDLVIAAPDLRHVRAEIPLSGTVINEQPGGLVLADGSLWSVTEKGTVTQLDLRHRRVVGSTPLALPAGPGGMAVGLGATWVTDSGSPTLYRLGSGITAARRIGLPRLSGSLTAGARGIAAGAGSLWVARAAGTVDRLSPDGQLEHRFRIPAAEQVISDNRGIWVVSSRLGVVTKLEPRTDSVRARTRLRPNVCCLAVGGGSVWATSEATGLLWQLGPDGGVQNVVHVPAPATEVAYAAGAVWVAGYTGGTVTRVDAQTLKVRVVHTDQPVAGLAAAPRIVAFSTFASDRAALAGVRGPIARIVLPHDVVSDIDPATPGIFGDPDADRQSLAPTCLSLYEYRGGHLAPYAASGAAVRGSSGRVWKIRVRSGFAFSPPSHEPVDATTFAATIERSTAPALRHSEAANALADVVGMDAYRRGVTTHLAGVSAHGDGLTIRLRRPASDLDARLASPYFCAVPKETPAVPTGLQDPIPSAGPYYVAGVGGGAFEVLRRNPHYPRPNHGGFSAFVYTFNVDPPRALDMIRHGHADYAAFYEGEAASAARLRSTAEAQGVRFRLSRRPGRGRSKVVEFLGRRVGCRSYSPLYVAVELKRLCPAAGG